MTDEKINPTVMKCLIEILDNDFNIQANEDTTQENLIIRESWDELDTINFIYKIEDNFDIVVDNEECFKNWKSLRYLAVMIDAKLAV